jgi:hypothetical protein
MNLVLAFTQNITSGFLFSRMMHIYNAIVTYPFLSWRQDIPATDPLHSPKMPDVTIAKIALGERITVLQAHLANIITQGLIFNYSTKVLHPSFRSILQTSSVY